MTEYIERAEVFRVIQPKPSHTSKVVLSISNQVNPDKDGTFLKIVRRDYDESGKPVAKYVLNQAGQWLLITEAGMELPSDCFFEITNALPIFQVTP